MMEYLRPLNTNDFMMLTYSLKQVMSSEERRRESMLCNQCNWETLVDSRFCEFCGAELKAPAKTPKQAFARKKIVAIVIGVLVLIGAAVVVAFYINYGQHGEYHQQIRTGEQYLKEQDYEKAETAYLDAIKLEPKQEKGYIKAADLYIKQENY